MQAAIVQRALDEQEEAFFAALADRPDDLATPLVYADWLEERGSPHARLLRVWVDLSWRASHAASGFRDLLAEYRRLWLASDPEWRAAIGSARPWVSPGLAEELSRGYLRYVEKRPANQRGVIRGETESFTEAGARGWLVRYWYGRSYRDARRQEREYKWVLFVQSELGWVYPIATAGPRAWLPRYNTSAGDGHKF